MYRPRLPTLEFHFCHYLCNFEQVYLTLVSKFESHSLYNVISSVGELPSGKSEEILLGFSSLHKCFLYAKSFTDKLTPSLKLDVRKQTLKSKGLQVLYMLLGFGKLGRPEIHVSKGDLAIRL